MTTERHSLVPLPPVRRVALVLLAVLAAVVVGPPSFAQAAPQQPTSTRAVDDDLAWSVRPATADGKPDARTHFTLQGAPGDEVIDTVLVSNSGTAAASYDVYATDAFNTPAGAYDLLPAATRPVDIGSWVTFAARTVTIPAGGSVALQFKVNVPANATPGDHAGGVVIGLSTGNDVRLDTRVAVRLYLRVPGFLRPALAVPFLRPAYVGVANPVGSGRVTVEYTVSNPGNIRLRSHPTIVVTSALFGTKLAEVTPEDLPELLPGGQANFVAELPGVFPAGPLTVTVEVRPFPDPEQPVGQDVAVASASATIWAFSWLLVLTLIILIGLIIGVLLFVRARRRRGRNRLDSAVATAAEKARDEGRQEALAEAGEKR